MKAVRIHQFGGPRSSHLRRNPRRKAATGSGLGAGKGLLAQSSGYLGA